LILTFSFIRVLAAGRDVNNVRANVLFILDFNNVIVIVNEAGVDLRELSGKVNNFVKSGLREFLCRCHLTLAAITPCNLIETHQLMRDLARQLVDLLR
jgi:hypothetical protein